MSDADGGAPLDREGLTELAPPEPAATPARPPRARRARLAAAALRAVVFPGFRAATARASFLALRPLA